MKPYRMEEQVVYTVLVTVHTTFPMPKDATDEEVLEEARDGCTTPFGSIVDAEIIAKVPTVNVEQEGDEGNG